uniref:Uncharacterized protein n=1 Tax=Tanacetum cinerariifolium TaxID=118510 RepID=A0A6L2LNG6_TANCI|nr:hypothetical protein [Tanacetum cinerariifolium]
MSSQYAKLEKERYEYMIRYTALCDNDKQHRKKIDKQEILFDKMSCQLVEMNNNVLRLQEKILEKETKILELEGCVSNKDVEIEKCSKRLNECENKLHKIRQTNQTIHMIMPSKDTLYNGRKGIEIINPDFEKIDSPFQQTNSLKPYVPNVILEKIIIDLEDEVVSLLEKEKANLKTMESLKSKGFESSENAISKSKNQSENDYHVVENECHQMENSKVIAPGMFKLSVSQSVSSISMSKTSCDSKNVENLLSCNNSHLGETSSAYVCNDAMNVSCNSRMCDSFDENNLFIFDDESVRIFSVSKMPFRKKPRDSMNVRSKSNSNKSLHRTVHMWLPKMQPLAEPVAKWIPRIVQVCLWIIDSRCSKHMTGNRALLTNFVEKFLGTVRFGNNDFAVIAGYGDVVIGSMTTKKVYYSTCSVRNEYDVDLLTGDRSSNLYTIALNEVTSNSSTCLLAKASSLQSWLWHQRLSHLNFTTINNLVKNNLVQAIATACFTQNRLIIHKRFDKTPYELMNKRKPNIKLFRVFRSRCYLLNDYEDVEKLKAKGDIGVFVGYSKESAAFRIYNKRTRKIHKSVNVNFDEISEMASKQFSLEPGLSNLNETRKSSNPSVLQVSETLKKDLEDLFHNFYDEYFDSSKIMKSSTTNVETYNAEIPSHEEVFHESSESFQEESSSSSVNDDVQKSSEEVGVPSSNTQSISNNMVLNVVEASTSHNVFNKRLEDAYFDASTSFHDPSNVHTFYQPYPHEKK